MARVGAAASSNWTAADKGVCDSTAAWVIDSEAGTLTITTSTSTHISPSATPTGAITIDGVYLKVSSRVASPTGTFTVVLRNTTLGADVTSVVVNVADIKLYGGWHFFKFSSPQTTIMTTAYAIRVTCSVTGEVTLFRSTASAQEYCRLIRTTTTAAPGAGDQILITNELTGAGTSNALTVTMDETATTIYGATSYVDSISISGGGTLTWGTSGSTNYILKVAGTVSVWSGSTWNRGTSGGRMPSTSTARLIFSVASNVDSGLVMKPGCVYNDYGNIVVADSTLLTLSNGGYCSTSGTLVTRVTGQSFTGLTGTIRINSVNYTISSVVNGDSLILTGSAGTQTKVVYTHAGTANVLTVGSTSGWAAGDGLAVASTSRTAADCEEATIQSVDSSTQVTLTAAMANQHSGDSPTQAEVIHLSRNVRTEGTSTSLQGYVRCETTSVVNKSYVELRYLGSNTVNTRGIALQTTTGSYTAVGCICRDSGVTGSRAWDLQSSSNNNISVTYSHNFNIAGVAVTVVATSGTSITIDHCIGMKNTSGNLFTLGDCGCVFTNLTAVGHASAGFSISEGAFITGTISGLTAHSGGQLLSISNSLGGEISSITGWRTANDPAVQVSSSSNVTLSQVVLFGGSTNMALLVCDNTYIDGATISGDVCFSSGTGISLSSNSGTIYISNASLGVVSGIKTAHTTGDTQSLGSIGNVIFRNSLLASSNEVAFQASISVGSSSIRSQKHDQTAGLHKRWERFGTAITDTVTYRTASPAEKLTPINASFKFGSSDTQPIAIDNGQTATVTVYVYKSASYNGAQPRLILRRNAAIGITSDIVLATASGGTGSWLALSGTTPAATDDGAIVCYVDCDGTAGTVTVDDWSVA